MTNKTRELDSEKTEEYFFAQNTNMPISEYFSQVKMYLEAFRINNFGNKLEKETKQ